MSKTLATPTPGSPAPAASAPAGGAAAPAKGGGAGAAATPPVAAPAAGAAEGGKTKETKAKAAPAAEPEIPALGADVDDEAQTDEVPALGADAGTDEDTDAEGDAATDDAEGAEGDEPELNYEFELEEGQEPLRQPVIDAYTEALRRHKIAPQAAQDILRSVMPVIRSEAEAATKEHIDATTTQWREELKKRHGAKVGDVIKLANRGLAKAATPELRKFIQGSVLAANPDFIDMLAWFSQRVTNDRTTKSTEAPARRELSPLEELAREYDAADTK